VRYAPAQPVTFDINVFVLAVSGGPHAYWAWPSPPPLGGNLAASCLGIVNDAQEFSLWLSPHILTNVLRVLAELDWSRDRALEYLQILREIAEASGGGIIEPEVKVDDCSDYEDNRILELALASGSVLIVSDDGDLLTMSPWRGIPIIRPSEFAGRVDAMRRARRRQLGT
jgi:putative PIN family toxin of toxin-antitoxin system